MNVTEFQSSCYNIFKHTLNWFHNEHQKGTLTYPNEPSYATQLRIAVSPTHYLAELFGSKSFLAKEEIDISIKPMERLTDSTSFFLPGKKIVGDEPAIMRFYGQDHRVTGKFVLGVGVDFQEAEKRLGLKLPSVKLTYKEGVALKIEDAADKVFITNMDVLRVEGVRIYFRNVVLGIAIQKSSLSVLQFKNWLKGNIEGPFFECKQAVGVLYDYDTTKERIARQLISLSEQKISEKLIDNFLEEQRDTFASALGYEKAYPKCRFKWVQRENNDPCVSIPDYLMKRKDGSFDILDLKKGFIGRKLTKGKPARLRFIDCVTELIAQLVMYQRYFNFEKNRKFARETYGIKTDNTIKLIGIVGNYYEFESDEVNKALTQYKDNITLIGYADLANYIRLSNH